MKATREALEELVYFFSWNRLVIPAFLVFVVRVGMLCCGRVRIFFVHGSLMAVIVGEFAG